MPGNIGTELINLNGGNCLYPIRIMGKLSTLNKRLLLHSAQSYTVDWSIQYGNLNIHIYLEYQYIHYENRKSLVGT